MDDQHQTSVTFLQFDADQAIVKLGDGVELQLPAKLFPEDAAAGDTFMMRKSGTFSAEEAKQTVNELLRET